MIYLDTNAILANYEKSSPYYSSTKKIFQIPNLEFYTGIISILELEAVIARNLDVFSSKFTFLPHQELGDLADNQKIPLICQYMIKKLNISMRSTATIENFEINQNKYDILNTFYLAIRLNRDLKLRTLDAIQIASAIEIKVYYEVDLTYFLTNDQTILAQKELILQKSRILSISSVNLARLLCGED